MSKYPNSFGSGRNRRGGAAVELAMILPSMLILLFGCVDLARFAYQHIAVMNAARAAAGYGMMNTYVPGNAASQTLWTNRAKQAAADEMTGQMGFNSSNLTVTVTLTDDLGNGDTRVTATASYPFSMVMTWPGLPKNLTLSGKASVRKIR